MKMDRQLVMSRTSSRIKSVEKQREGFGLVTKIYIFFGTFRALQDFSKMTKFMGIDGRDIYQF